MSCRDIRETISAFVDGEASPDESIAVREHLASCERCRLLERQMRAVGAGVRQIRGTVPDRFRETVFARLEAEGAFPPPMRARARSWRWTAVPLAAAAALGLFLLTSGDAVRKSSIPGPSTARVKTSSPAAPAPGTAVSLTTEDRETIALLDVLEDTSAFDDDGDAGGVDLLAPGNEAEPPGPVRGARNGA